MSPLSSLRNGEEYKGELSTNIGRRADLYWSESEPILVDSATYIGQPTDQYRFAPPSTMKMGVRGMESLT